MALLQNTVSKVKKFTKTQKLSTKTKLNVLKTTTNKPTFIFSNVTNTKSFGLTPITNIQKRFISHDLLFQLEMNRVVIGPQTVLAGTDALDAFAKEWKKISQRPLIVTDEGVSKIGIVKQVVEHLKKSGFTPVLYDKTKPNPGTDDVVGIAKAYVYGGCDSCIGLGGGGPLDAAKAGMALVGVRATSSKFNFDADGPAWIEGIRYFLQKNKDTTFFKQFCEAVPPIAGIPTTAGTGSEGGKSAVITDRKGVKRVFGHPIFLPKTVALIPQFTEKLPKHLTAATGIDALFHNMEALFVTHAAAINDGMNDAEIKVTDDFAIKGIELVTRNLPKAFADGSDLQVRLNMQFAALYGAKAFRKGDLGGVHATAHAVGAKYHIHHGTAIARMAIPVLKYNSTRISEETKKSFAQVHEIYKANGYKGENLVESCGAFLKQFGIPYGLVGLPTKESDYAELAQLASKDGCQTNPVPLTEQDYLAIFESAKKQ